MVEIGHPNFATDVPPERKFRWNFAHISVQDYQIKHMMKKEWGWEKAELLGYKKPDSELAQYEVMKKVAHEKTWTAIHVKCVRDDAVLLQKLRESDAQFRYVKKNKKEEVKDEKKVKLKLKKQKREE